MNPLPCLNCQELRCPIDEKAPPCQRIDPQLIADAANRRLEGITGNLVSAVIAVYRPKLENLERCLECVLPQVDEVVICGDLDTEEWPPPVRFQDSKIKWVRLDAKNTGYANKVNRGVRESVGSVAFTLNDDVFAGPDVVQKLKTIMDSDPEIGAVTHLLLYPDKSVQFGGLGRPPGAIGFGHVGHMQPKCLYSNPIPQESLCGASVLIRRKAFYSAGAFPESYFLYSEDTDFGLSLRRAGWKIVFTPHAVGTHIEHQSTSQTGDVKELCRVSNEIFRARWKWYFDRNPDPTKLGVFDK